MKVSFLVFSLVFLLLGLSACGGRTDAEMQADAAKALKAEPSTARVVVEVKDGVAMVSGEVADDAAKAKAAELVQVEGVKTVKNDVTVAPAPPPIASADDSAQQTKLEEALKAKNCGDITVEVKDGKATLRGKISQEKFAECLLAARQSNPNIDNLLEVEN